MPTLLVACTDAVSAGAYTTFWNIKSKLGVLLPHGHLPSWTEAFETETLGPRLNFVGLKSTDTRVSPLGWAVELAPGVGLGQPNLQEAMRVQRLRHGWVSSMAQA